MKSRAFAIAMGVLLLAPLAPPIAAADEDSRTHDFRTRYQGLVAFALWSTCPTDTADVGDVCTDTFLFAFNAKTRDGKVKDRGPTVKTQTFVYRLVGGEIGAEPVAEWFTRTNDAVVTYRPRLQSARAQSDGEVLLCSVFDETAGYECPDSVPVDVKWTATGELQRFDTHHIRREPMRMENTWERGWNRTATVSGTLGDGALGELLYADLTRADQGEIIVQHPLP